MSIFDFGRMEKIKYTRFFAFYVNDIFRWVKVSLLCVSPLNKIIHFGLIYRWVSYNISYCRILLAFLYLCGIYLTPCGVGYVWIIVIFLWFIWYIWMPSFYFCIFGLRNTGILYDNSRNMLKLRVWMCISVEKIYEPTHLCGHFESRMLPRLSFDVLMNRKLWYDLLFDLGCDFHTISWGVCTVKLWYNFNS